MNHSYSPSRIKEQKPSTPDHIPFRSAGGASTGAFAAPRVLHFVPPDPTKKCGSNESDNEKDEMSSVESQPRKEQQAPNIYNDDTDINQQHTVEKSTIEKVEEEESESVPSISETDPHSASDDEGTTPTLKHKKSNVNDNVAQHLTNDSIELHRLAIVQMTKTFKFNENIGSVGDDNDSSHCETSSQHEMMNTSLQDDDIGDVSKVDTSFASDFSCEIERMTSMHNHSNPNGEESSADSSDGEWSEDEENHEWSEGEMSESGGDDDDVSEDASELILTDCCTVQLENNRDVSALTIPECGAKSPLSDNDDSHQNDIPDGNEGDAQGLGAMRSPWGKHYSIDSSSTMTSVEDAGLGAMRSPWGNNRAESIDSSQQNESGSNLTSIDYGKDLGATKAPFDTQNVNPMDVSRDDSEEDAKALRSPWAKYLQDSEKNDSDVDSHDSSSGCVSSLTNQSCVTHLSSSTCASNQSPTLQHLEFLARNSTAAYVSSFTPKPKIRVPLMSPLKVASNRLSLKELRDIYGCKTRRDAMQLAFDQSNCLSKASNDLVDLLFEYLHQHCGAQTHNLFAEDDGDKKMNAKGKAGSSQKGLSLPAAAIGWLSSYICPDKVDRQ